MGKSPPFLVFGFLLFSKKRIKGMFGNRREDSSIIFRHAMLSSLRIFHEEDSRSSTFGKHLFSCGFTCTTSNSHKLFPYQVARKKGSFVKNL